ncbi:hypothetical protein HCDSEM_058 [Candidatus Hodgkinia cicadicola Dsem]|nr:hypothetical protein HCDSEM_058 [Candidatus Hodgkinia cicadicola Dsem]
MLATALLACLARLCAFDADDVDVVVLRCWLKLTARALAKLRAAHAARVGWRCRFVSRHWWREGLSFAHVAGKRAKRFGVPQTC